MNLPLEYHAQCENEHCNHVTILTKNVKQKVTCQGCNEEYEYIPSKTSRLSALYRFANGLNEGLPGDLIKKLTVYGMILELLGGFHAQATKAWKLAEAYRRETLASAYTYSEGTGADRTNKAEIAAAKHRQDEAEAEAEATRWKNAYISTQEQIQIMKLQLKDMKDVQGGGV